MVADIAFTAVISATKSEENEIGFSPHFYRYGETKHPSVDHQLKRVIALIFEVTSECHT